MSTRRRGALWVLILACALPALIFGVHWRCCCGRLAPNGEVFSGWQCVALAMIAGLVARMLVEPVGVLATTSLLGDLARRLVGWGCVLLLTRNLLGCGQRVCVVIVLLQLLR